MTNKEKDLVQRAQDIQRYTENRCNTLEERNAKLEKENKELKKIIEGYREAKNVIHSLNPIEWGDGFHFNVNMILNNVENPK